MMGASGNRAMKSGHLPCRFLTSKLTSAPISCRKRATTNSKSVSYHRLRRRCRKYCWVSTGNLDKLSFKKRRLSRASGVLDLASQSSVCSPRCAYELSFCAGSGSQIGSEFNSPESIGLSLSRIIFLLLGHCSTAGQCIRQVSRLFQDEVRQFGQQPLAA